MGVYMISASMKATKRAKCNNVYTITFGPHGTNFPDVIEVLEPSLALLDKGINMNISSKRVTRVIFSCLCFLGDMPQQNANAGIKEPTATCSCQSCMVLENQQHDMDFDTIAKGHYHFQILQQREKINSTETQALKQSLCKEYEMAKEQTALLKICPSLNLVTFFSSDPCHSEFSGISKLAHYLLVSVILTPHGQKEYCKLLQRFPFCQRWACLQSLLTHLESYQLQEHVLIDAAASAVETTHPAGTQAGSRAASITSARPSPVPIELLALDSYVKETGVPIAENFNSKKKTKAIQSFKNHPNMHVDIHYPAQANEYAILNNCNILIGENKHQKYKKLVQRTNKCTLLLLLEEAFANNEFEAPDAEGKDIAVEPGSTTIWFYKNITFSLGDQQIKLMIDDLIEYTHGTSPAIRQITSIFIHELHTNERVFFSVIPALEMMRDQVLDLPIVQVDLGGGNYTIIGLPAIKKLSLYAIPISEVLDASSNLVFSGHDSRTFLLCTWDVSFL
ncbi:uncharacterized protein CIMG_13536 [Coccidioides immitis RS]|uniref:Uncharacterized protein n=1 Tax=Coccidioides immitis (strain RS) TaxID=246410 RepID=J3K0Q9_COCIM|nr:uncharacterized protein CIMG_13536 [Coccidioides immitis RS]EAS27452.3 hypothetical protein CIMG_13536 [Coccidioides immitis RS]